MAKFYESLPEKLQDFIKAQKIFFVASADKDGRVNLSPKGLDSLRIVDANNLIWLNFTGSGNETAAHLKEVNRMTLMFCAFEGNPLILRVYGTAKTVHPADANWEDLSQHFDIAHGARQIFQVSIESVQTSCGFGVPLMNFQGERPTLTDWANKKNQEEIEDYWRLKNTQSIDGKPTGIFDNVS